MNGILYPDPYFPNKDLVTVSSFVRITRPDLCYFGDADMIEKFRKGDINRIPGKLKLSNGKYEVSSYKVEEILSETKLGWILHRGQLNQPWCSIYNHETNMFDDKVYVDSSLDNKYISWDDDQLIKGANHMGQLYRSKIFYSLREQLREYAFMEIVIKDHGEFDLVKTLN